MDEPVVRLLTAQDVAQYRKVRLWALTEHPEGFGSSAEEFEQQPLEEVAKRLSAPSDTYSLFGAFLADEFGRLDCFWPQQWVKKCVIEAVSITCTWPQKCVGVVWDDFFWNML